MISLHCLCAKSNNRTRGQFEYDVLGFVFVLISFVHMHGEKKSKEVRQKERKAIQD